MAPLVKRMPAFCHPWEFFAFLIVDKERSEILAEFGLGLCDMLEISISPPYTHTKFNLIVISPPPPPTHTHTHTEYQFDCDSIKYEINSQILYDMIRPGQFCHL